MLIAYTDGSISDGGKIVAYFHPDPARGGTWIAYRPGRRDEALEWHNSARGCGPTFASPGQVLDFLKSKGL